MATPGSTRAGPAIDRIAPTRRPDRRAVMRQSWSELLFLHWPIPAGAVAPLLPAGLEVDRHDGTAWVGLVPFTMTGVRPFWSPSVPGLSAFHEVNVRTYVHREGRDPGVWFFSLDAANPVAVAIARTLWHLPYYRARMRLDVEEAGGRTIRYESRRRGGGPGCRVAYRVTGEPGPAALGSFEFFLAERYLLYAHARGRLLVGQVHHTPYPLQTAALLTLDEDLIAAAGIARPDRPPLVHYARRVDVEVFPLEPAVSRA